MRPCSRIFFVFACLLLFFNCTNNPNRFNTPKKTIDASKWVETTLRSMTLREKVGQMFFAAVRARHHSQDDRELQNIEALVKEWGIGGVHAWGGEPYAQVWLANHLQKSAKIPLLFTADFENGMGPRFTGGTYFPPAMAIAASGDTIFARELGRITALEGRALGIQLTFSPVVDVNSNPLNPIINTRSFGETPENVARFASAFIRDAKAGGLLTTAKHFPGHGDTEQDSHITLPTINADLARLHAVELAPFKTVIDAGVDAIMTAHINLKKMEMNPYYPATLAPEILTNLLREKMRFDGVIITDAMQMNAVRQNFTDKFAAVSAVKAGADVLLVSPDIPAALDAVMRAVASGEISEQRIDASVRRILSAKAKAGLHQTRFAHADALPKKFGLSASAEIARACARKAMTLLKNDHSVLPLRRSIQDSIAVIAIMDSPSRYHADRFVVRLKNALPSLVYAEMHPGMAAAAFEQIHEKIQNSALIVLPVFATLTSGKSSLQIPEEMLSEISKIVDSGKPVVVVSFGNPYIIQQLQGVDAYLCAYDDHDLMQEAVAEALLGRAPITGKIPVSIPGFCVRGAGIVLQPKEALPDVAPTKSAQPGLRVALPEEAGFSPDSLRKVDALMQEAVADSVFPGATLLIAKDAMIVHHKTYGRMGYGEYAKPVPLNAIYDLASVTKVIATTTAAMLLVDQGRLDLDATVQSYLPAFSGEGKGSITVRNFLVHNSGLPPFKRYFLESTRPGEIIARILAEPLEYTPNTDTRYSDLGVILTGKIIEKMTGQPLDVFCREKIFGPLGMHETFFNPPEIYWPRIPPTEDDPWRGRMVHGVVHDENAFALGGVAGHAGLFSTVQDLAKLLQLLLNGGEYNGVKLLSKDVIKKFTSRQDLTEGSTRAIGWDTRSEQNSSSGHLMSMRAFGHTGFTGNSVWVDPEKNLFVILLSNRVHPTRENRKIYRFRPVLHDAVLRGMIR